MGGVVLPGIGCGSAGAMRRRASSSAAALAIASVIWLASFAGFAAMPDAGGHADGGDADAGDAEAGGAPDLDALRAELASLEAFLAGRLGPRRSAELFRVDLESDVAAARRVEALAKELTAARAAAPDASVADAAVDAAPPPPEQLARTLGVHILEAKRAILALPRERRLALLAAEEEAVRAEAARREREEAEREAQRAEAAHLDALAAMKDARSATERQLAEARSKVEAARADQLRAAADVADLRRALLGSAATRAEALARLERESNAVAAASADADALYDRIVEELVRLRARGDELLGETEKTITIPRVPKGVTLPDAGDAELAARRDRIAEAIVALDGGATSLETEKRELLWAALRSVMAAERTLNERRIELIERVSPAKRDRVLGFGAEGRAQGLREVRRVGLEVRWLRATGDALVRETFADLKRPARIVGIALQVIALAAILSAAMFVRRRIGPWLAAASEAMPELVHSAGVARALQKIAGAFAAIAVEVVSLGAVLLVPVVSRIEVHDGPASVPYALLQWYWAYRVALATTHRGIAWLAATDEGTISEDTGTKILRSARLVGRTSFLFAVLLAASAAVVGRGYLHTLIARAAYVLAIPVAVILVRWWRDDIARAFLAIRPTGRLSALVARTRTRWIGFFVAIAAFGVLLGAWVVHVVRTFVLRFERSRKTLAFLFRRRLEKQGERAAPRRAVLEPEVLAFFTEAPVETEELRVDRFPGLAELETRFERFRAGERVGATVVVGRTGHGKTSWLRAAASRCSGMPSHTITLRVRTTDPCEVAATIARAVGAPEAVRDLDTLAAHLLASERRVVVVDEAQLWFLRGVQTLDAWRGFTRLVERTGDKVLWLAAFAHYPWEFVRWIAKGDVVFRTIVELPPWSEQELGKLLGRRNEASGLTIVYDDLIVDRVSGADAKKQVLSTAHDYNRLVWDYSEGSPRVALHVWGRSLVPDGPGRARVRLFDSPRAAVLDALSESAKFVLASVVWHERLSLDDAVSVLLLPRSACEEAFARLEDAGVAIREEGHLRIEPLWWPVVIRYLRRNHLVET